VSKLGARDDVPSQTNQTKDEERMSKQWALITGASRDPRGTQGVQR
jgi:hypothetical protein